MSAARNEARRGLRGSASILAIVVAVLAVSSHDAVARRRHHVDSEPSSPPSASIVIDANSGNALQSAKPDELRHPASLTKIMTLYLLFEQLDAGKLKLDSPLRVSEHAAGQSPTKLGLKPGTTITAEEAIKGMVTRSANDAAVVVAENLGGSEEQFAAMMTRKAHALGMSKTVYRNASGLPSDEQVTTARDQSTLGRAIQERFPRYYPYFQTRSFSFHGQSIGNHNRLLGRVEGVDGIKTGYTQASGYNLVTSVHRKGRYLVAVVLGGATAGSRDARMEQLIEAHINNGSIKHTAPIIAEASMQAVAAPAAATQATQKPAAKDPERFTLANAKSVPANPDPSVTAPPNTNDRAKPGSTEPIRPVLVKTLNVRPTSTVQTASANPLQFNRISKAADPLGTAASPAESKKADAASPAAGTGAAPAVAPIRAIGDRTEIVPASLPPKPTRSGWMIQIGAYADENEAKQKLDAAKSKASHLLAAADPFTEAVQKDGTTYYRARFAGFNKEQADAACKYLKRSDIECLAIRN
jgi:D-alanyl-D-alanine carboxypeptidase